MLKELKLLARESSSPPELTFLSTSLSISLSILFLYVPRISLNLYRSPSELTIYLKFLSVNSSFWNMALTVSLSKCTIFYLNRPTSSFRSSEPEPSVSNLVKMVSIISFCLISCSLMRYSFLTNGMLAIFYS